jgi:hypothetical protein
MSFVVATFRTSFFTIPGFLDGTNRMISITRATSALLSTAKIANRREISTEFGQVEGLTGLSSTADDTANDNLPHRLAASTSK